MAVDFGSLLRKPSGEATKPKPLPTGDYPARVLGYETKEAKNEKKTPFLEFRLGVTGWPDTVTEEEREGIDLASKQLRGNVYLTQESMWRLDQLLRTMGIELGAGRTYEEALRDTINQEVTVSVTQGVSTKNSEVYNSVERFAGPVAVEEPQG